jgi:hypothetical protein
MKPIEVRPEVNLLSLPYEGKCGHAELGVAADMRDLNNQDLYNITRDDRNER